MKQLTTLLATLLISSSSFYAQCPGLNSNAFPTDITCFGFADGQISSSPSGGVGPFFYQLLDPNNNMISANSTGNFMGLVAGSYNLVIQDQGNACYDTTVVLVNEPDPIQAFETIVPDNGLSSGSISLTVIGGVNSYSFNWTGPNGFTSVNQDITGLEAGVYVVDIVDANGCFLTQTFTVLSAAISTTFYTMDPFCFGEPNGGISVTINGGTGSYNFQITDLSYNALFSSTSSTDYYNLIAGQYYYIATDLGSSYADTNYFELYDPAPVTVVESITHETCGQCNGAITLNVFGGTATYTVSWSNGSTTFNQSGLCSGTYTVDLYDANGCYSTYTYTVTSTGGTPFTGTTTPTASTCSNCDGSIAFTPTSGTAPYNYLWDDPTAQNTSSANNLCAGVYSVAVTDASGCTITFTDTVDTGAWVYGSVINSAPSSCLACDGSVEVTGAGGTGPYTYVNVLTQDTNSTGLFDSLCPNVNYVQVIDANGCSGIVSYTIAQIELPGLNFSDSTVDESTIGANDGSINISYDSGLYSDLDFLWQPDSSTSEDLYNVPNGTYWVQITDSASGGCGTYVSTVGVLASSAYISGQLYQDNNGDCSYNAGDSYLANVLITISDGTNTYTALTNSYGYYYVLVPNGSYTVEPTFPSNYTTSCGISQNVTIAGSNVSGVNFFATASPYEDLCVYNYGWGFTPGFTAYIYVYVQNNGNVTSDGDLSVVIPSGTTYLWSDITPSSVNGDTLFFSMSNLAPSSYSTFYIALDIPTWFQLGDIVEICSSIDLLGGGTDVNLACNNDCYYDIVVGSYDPNDKAVDPMGIDSPGYIETDENEFTYTIRFQNTGTAPAHNVYITDTLDAMLDRGTLQVLAASHDMYIEYYMDDVVRFRFDNIMLADSNSNEPESHGYVQFKINTKNAPQLTETVENTANIYFDFNEPVITNTTLNTYADFSSVSEESNSKLLVYPNPTNGKIHLSVQDQSSYKIIDMNGKLIQNGSAFANQSIEVSSLTSGIYFIEIESSSEILRSKFTKE